MAGGCAGGGPPPYRWPGSRVRRGLGRSSRDRPHSPVPAPESSVPGLSVPGPYAEDLHVEDLYGEGLYGEGPYGEGLSGPGSVPWPVAPASPGGPPRSTAAAPGPSTATPTESVDPAPSTTTPTASADPTDPAPIAVPCSRRPP